MKTLTVETLAAEELARGLLSPVGLRVVELRDGRRVAVGGLRIAISDGDLVDLANEVDELAEMDPSLEVLRDRMWGLADDRQEQLEYDEWRRDLLVEGDEE